MTIRSMTQKDWPEVAEIYLEGISTGYATFETSVPDFENWNKTHLKKCRLIVEKEATILGWAALSPVSSRPVYRGIGEVSVYISEVSRGLGVGKALLLKLIEESEKEGYWTIQSGIFPENMASIKLHKKVGFRFIGKREKIGKTKDGLWKDNLLFEKRSKIVGT